MTDNSDYFANLMGIEEGELTVPDDDSESCLGHMTCQWTVWCSKCDEWDLGDNYQLKKNAERAIREKGWKQRRGLWVCPKCLALEKSRGV